MNKRRQTSLLSWGTTSGTTPKRLHRSEAETETSTCESSVADAVSSSTEDEDEQSVVLDPPEVCVDMSGVMGSESEASHCSALCCTVKAYQPTDAETLASLVFKGRRFEVHWFKRFAWLSVCMTSKKVYCVCCRYATQHNLITFSKKGEKSFAETGFNNW